MSRFDVIVPCYRYAHYLQGCVQSVLDQSVTDVRVLIIDDASPDDTASVAAEIVERDRRVEYRRHEANKGHIATYNEGLEWIAGDFTILLSADDLLAPGSLARAARLLDEDLEIGLVYGRGIDFSAEPPLWTGPVPESCPWRILEGTAFLESCFEDVGNPVCTPTAVTRTSLQRRLGGYRPELPHAGDLEMWLRFAAYSRVGLLDEVQAYYRVHQANMSHHWYNTTLADLEQRRDAVDVLFREHESALADPEALRTRAIRGLAWTSFWAATSAFEAGDPKRSQVILDFALGLDPSIRERREYANFAWKRRAGLRLWSAIRPAVELVRGRPARY